MLPRVVIDARPIDHPTARQRGIGRYTTGLIRGLHDIGVPLRALVSSAAEAEVVAPQLPGVDVRTHRPSVFDGEWSTAWYVATGLFLHPLSADPIPAYVTRAGVPVAGVLYDVIPYRFPEQFLHVEAAHRQAALRAPLARTCDAWLAISEFTAITATEHLRLKPSGVTSIGAGVDERFAPIPLQPRGRIDRLLGEGADHFVVAVTGKDPHKNNQRLLDAWGRVDPDLRATHRLVVVANIDPGTRRQWQIWADEAGCGQSVTFTGGVSDDDLIGLLQHAKLAVMASLEEGFGLPVAEAAACGCPTICSDVSSLPEVLGEPRACFDPLGPGVIARRIERALTDSEDRRMLLDAAGRSAERWRWPSVAQHAIGALGAFAAKSPAGGGSRRRRVTVVSDESVDPGVAAELSKQLRGRSDVDLVVPIGHASALGRLVPVHDVDVVVTIVDAGRSDGVAHRLATRFETHVWLAASSTGVDGHRARDADVTRWATTVATSLNHGRVLHRLNSHVPTIHVDVKSSQVSIGDACQQVIEQILSRHGG